MSLYFGETEITNIDNLAPQTGLDITELWFGSTNVYTVWQTYEGTLPATINANGDDMRQYQIYGADGGVGDVTENLFDKNTMVVAKYINANGVETDSMAQLNSGVRLHHSGYIPIIEETNYTLFSEHGSMIISGQTIAFCWYDLNKNFLGRSTQYIEQTLEDGSYSFTAESPLNAAFTIVNFFTNKFASVIVVKGSTAPATYIPYGYEVDMGVKSGNLLCATATDTVVGNETSVSTAKNSSDFIINAATTGNRSITVPLNITLSAGTYTLSVYGLHIVADTFDRCNIRDTDGNYYGTSLTTPTSPTTFTIQEAVTINRLSFVIYKGEVYDNEKIGVCLVRGTAAPTKYQPYSNTTTSIYIGSDPLEKDEYVDYKAQKIYRKIDNVLTPTDPPVALPALPTCEGTTIVDYAGQSVATPEKVVFEYRKEGF